MHLANLVVMGGHSRGKAVPLGSNVIIGRRPDATLCLKDNDISWNHARIEIYNEQIWIADLGSSNGTFVNGVRLSEHWTPLYPGSQVHFGKVPAQISEVARKEPEEVGWPAIPDVAALNLDVPPVEPQEAFPLPRQATPVGATTGRLRPFNPAYAPPPQRPIKVTHTPPGEQTYLHHPTIKVPKLKTPDRDRPRIFLTVPVHNLDLARNFYGAIMGCSEGKSTGDGVIFDFWGHHIKLYPSPTVGADNDVVDREGIPMRRYGLILSKGAWTRLGRRLETQGVGFLVHPCTRFMSGLGQQSLMIFQDPSMNTLEVRSSDDPDNALLP